MFCDLSVLLLWICKILAVAGVPDTPTSADLQIRSDLKMVSIKMQKISEHVTTSFKATDDQSLASLNQRLSPLEF